MSGLNPDHRPIISIFGSYSPQFGENLFEQAYRIGLALGAAGYTVCNGGYDGIMLASAKGAKKAGAPTIGVTCSIFTKERGKELKANEYIDREFHYCDLLERIETMMRISAGYVILEGGTGTMSEFAIVWEYVCKRLIAPRPICVVGDFWRPMADRILTARPKHGRHLHFVESPDEIVAVLKSADLPEVNPQDFIALQPVADAPDPQ